MVGSGATRDLKIIWIIPKPRRTIQCTKKDATNIYLRVRMAERSKALRSGRSLSWRRGFESHF